MIMGTLKRFYKESSFCDDAVSVFDLFGTNFLSKEEFNKFRLNQSGVEVVEDDREVFIRDFWEALSQYENKVETA
jgi:hypothetical protein